MNAARFKARRSRRRGVSITELLIALAVLLILAGIFLPMLARSGRRGSRINCVNNLKQVGLAFRIFSSDNEDKFPMQVSVTNGGFLELMPNVPASAIFRVMSNELGAVKIVLCPEDKGRKPALDFGPGFSNTNVSYFVGLDAQGSARWEESAQWVLAGDRSLTANRKPVGSGMVLLSTNQMLGWDSKLHRGYGNLCFGDGSVQQKTNAQLQAAFAGTGVATNRLAMP